MTGPRKGRAGESPGTPGESAPQGRTSGPQRGFDPDWSTLMALAQQGDKAAYRRLLQDVTPYLRRLAAARLSNDADVEDVVQEVLLTIHSLRHTYDPARPIGPWLAAVARHKIIDGFRASARKSARQRPLQAVHETFLTAPANSQESGADRHLLHEAIDGLPPGQREAIRLLKLQEMSLREASAASGMSIGALKVAAHRGLKSLRRRFARS